MLLQLGLLGQVGGFKLNILRMGNHRDPVKRELGRLKMTATKNNQTL